jgi:hypothetical protein
MAEPVQRCTAAPAGEGTLSIRMAVLKQKSIEIKLKYTNIAPCGAPEKEYN